MRTCEHENVIRRRAVRRLSPGALSPRRRSLRIPLSHAILLTPTAMLASLLSPIAVPFNLSNTLGDGMVLQRAPQSAVVWGFGTPGAKISLDFSGESLSAVVDGNSTWRMTLPPTPAPTIVFIIKPGLSAPMVDREVCRGLSGVWCGLPSRLNLGR